MTTSPEPRRRDVYSVASGGETIYAEATGAGRPVVLCHGLGGNHAIWWRQVHAFARGHRVVTWDQRGFGNSTAITGDISIEAAAADLLAVLDELDLRDACVIGQMANAGFTDAELQQLAVPVSFVAAEFDQFCPPAVMQYASKRFRDATMHVLEGASHSAYYEAPAAWNDLVLAIADGRVR